MGYGNGAGKLSSFIWGALAVLVLSAVPAAAQEGSFHALFGDGYKFLQKSGEGAARISVPALSAALEERAFQTLFEDGYAVVWREGRSVAKTEPVEARQVPEKSPFHTVFGEGYGPVVTPHGR